MRIAQRSFAYTVLKVAHGYRGSKTMPMTLQNAPTLHLLVELMKDGRANVLPDLAHLEPIDIDLIVATLRERTGIDFGRDFNAWYSWFVQDEQANEFERESLRLMREMVESTKFYVDRFNKNAKRD